MKREQTECSETSAYKIRTPGNYPEESIKPPEHGEILKSRITINCCLVAQKCAILEMIFFDRFEFVTAVLMKVQVIRNARNSDR